MFNSKHKQETEYSIPRTRGKQRQPILLEILAFFTSIALLFCILAAALVLSIRSELPDITAADLINAQTGFVYDANGTEFATLHGGEDRVSVPLDEMPTYLIDAVIASEDIRFYEHNGVDFRSLIRAAVVDIADTLRNRELTFTQGASTITMQLVKNVIGETEKTLTRKIKQILLALEFEKNYTKEEILYYYLNEIYLGANVYGVQSASLYYFNKDVSDLTIAEAATLVAILRAPAYYSPYESPDRTMMVRNAVLNEMITYKESVYKDSAVAAMAEPITVYYSENDRADYEHPWFVDYVIAEAIDILSNMGYDSSYVYTGGVRIYTTLDPYVQTAMETVYADDSNFPTSRTGDIVESAMAIVEPNTGQIKGLMGGRVYTTRRGYNRASDLIRSPGSTIKPLVAYGPAVELGYGAGTLIQDEPVTYGNWSPKNDDGGFAGYVSMRTAIIQSRNVCAVRTLEAITPQVGYEYGLELGLPLVEQDANLSLTLGGLTYGVSPLDMAAAFATFASDGVYTEPYSILRIDNMEGKTIYSAEPEKRQVFSAATSYIITDMLCDAVRMGTGTSARISGWQTAGKTGTNGLPTEDPDYRGKSGTKDAWFCGYTTALAGAVWMGYDNKTDDQGYLQYLTIYGGSYPARLFQKVMTLALENYENKDFVQPDGITYRVASKRSTQTSAGYGDMWVSGSAYLGLIGDPATYVDVQICNSSGQLATEYCPSTHTETVDEDDIPSSCTEHSKGWLPEDPGTSDTENSTDDEEYVHDEEEYQQRIEEWLNNVLP